MNDEPQRPQPDDMGRTVGRRKADAVRQDARAEVHAQRLMLVNFALAGVALWAIIATVTTVLLWLQTGRDQTALTNSNHATRTANHAVSRANRALGAIQSVQKEQAARLNASCERLNVARAVDNQTGSALFVLFRSVAGFDSAAEHRQRRGLHRHHRHLSRERRREERLFAHTLDHTVTSLAWTPLTNCVAAVASRGFAYQPPLPIPFKKRLPPPSALSSMNARRAQPVGSVL